MGCLYVCVNPCCGFRKFSLAHRFTVLLGVIKILSHFAALFLGLMLNRNLTFSPPPHLPQWSCCSRTVFIHFLIPVHPISLHGKSARETSSSSPLCLNVYSKICFSHFNRETIALCSNPLGIQPLTNTSPLRNKYRL